MTSEFSRPRLPPMRKGALLIENDPAVLKQYAINLREHLTYLRAGGRDKNYTSNAVKAATIWLIGSYRDLNVVMDSEAFELARDVIDAPREAHSSPVMTKSSKAYWMAVRFEAEHPSDPAKKHPSSASEYAIAKHVRGLGGFSHHAVTGEAAAQKSGEATVRGFRKSEHYCLNVEVQRRLFFTN